MRLCSISVDLDDLSCYSQIHGLAVTGSHAVYDVALPRIRDFAANAGLSLTLFVIARDLQRDQSVGRLRELVTDGHEVANHSLDHLYDLTLREPREQRRQVEGASAMLKQALGVSPRGFRAPGYTVTDQLLEAVRECGMTYDSSVFPCPPYYAAKAATRLRMKIAGRASRSIMDSPRVLRAPSTPYRVGKPYWTPGTGLLELPIQVAGPLRLPFIGTALTLLGPAASRLLTRSLVGTPFVNLELHGIDFLEARDVPPELLELQPDLRVPLARKLETLHAVVSTFRKHGYAAVRLDEAALQFS
ncbi:MAG: polysaccharide deacetylase family protein [Polyangiaceae bacterium]